MTGVQTCALPISHGAASFDLIRVGGADVEGSFVVSGPAVVAGKLPDSNASKALGVKYINEYEKVYGKGMANQFAAHAFDVVIVLEKAVPLALKKGKPGTQAFRTGLKEALETMGRTPVSQGVLNYTATDHVTREFARQSAQRRRSAGAKVEASRAHVEIEICHSAALQSQRIVFDKFGGAEHAPLFCVPGREDDRARRQRTVQ